MHDSFLPETKAPKVFLRMPSNTKGEIVMPICISTRKPKTSYLPAEIELSVLVGYYKKVLFSRKIRTLSALGGKAT